MYCAVVWQHVIGMVCVLCDGVAACCRYGVCTVRWCGSILKVYRYGMCTVRWCGSML